MLNDAPFHWFERFKWKLCFAIAKGAALFFAHYFYSFAVLRIYANQSRSISLMCSGARHYYTPSVAENFELDN